MKKLNEEINRIVGVFFVDLKNGCAHVVSTEHGTSVSGSNLGIMVELAKIAGVLIANGFSEEIIRGAIEIGIENPIREPAYYYCEDTNKEKDGVYGYFGLKEEEE